MMKVVQISRMLLGLVLVLVLGFLGGCGGKGGPGTSRPTNDRERADLQVIRQLKAAGSDFSKPHIIEHFFLGTDTARLEAAGEKLQSRGYIVSDVELMEGGGWYIQASKAIIITDKAVFAESTLMEKIASQHGLEYDGWGCAIVR